MNTSSYGSFGDLLRDFRKRRKMRQQELAERLGIHRNTIGTWERGDYLPDSKAMVLELARYLALGDEETRQLLEASLNALPRHWKVPFQRNPFFTGREEILASLHSALSAEKTGAVSRSVALSGTGGIGKTQTAVEYAYRYFQTYHAVFWLAAETPESLITSLVGLAGLLELPEQREQEQGRVVAAVLHWLNTHRDWLMIVDNVSSVDVVKPLLPTAREGSLLFTTRLPELNTLAFPLSLQPLSCTEGARFLLQRTGFNSPLSLAQPQAEWALEEIVTALGGLPLALEQAGAYIQKTQCSLAEFLQLFRVFPLEVLQEQDTAADHPLSVARTFALSFELLQHESPLAAEMLTACCLLAPDAIPEDLLLAYTPPSEQQDGLALVSRLRFNSLLKDLLAHAFISRNVHEKTLTVHRLVQLVIREQWDASALRQHAEQVIIALNSIFPGSEQLSAIESWPHCQLLVPQVFASVHLLDLYHILSPAGPDLLHRAGAYLHRRGQYQQAEQLLKRALVLQEKIGGSMNPALAPLLTTLGRLYMSQGRYPEAEPVLRRVFALSAQELGDEHPQTAKALQQWAFIHIELGKFGEAEKLYQRVLALYERVVAKDDPGWAEMFDDLGFLYYCQGRYTQAEHYYQRALDLCRQISGPEHPDTANVLNNLALTYIKQERYAECERIYGQALAIYHRTLGAEHSHTINALHNVALVYLRQRRYEEAEEHFLRVLLVLQENDLTNPTISSAAHRNLGSLYLDQRAYQQAEFHLQQALAIQERNLPSDHPNIASVLVHLARLAQEQERYTEAEAHYRRALEIRERKLGSDHPEVATTLRGYAGLLRAMRRADEARTLEHRAQTIQG